MEEYSSGNDDPESVHIRLANLEQAVLKLQLENAALTEEINKTKSDMQQNTCVISNDQRLELNFTLLQDSIKKLQDVNAINQQKLLLLQDELLTSRNESTALKSLISLLKREIAMMLTEFVDARHNITSLQQSIKLLPENITFLLDQLSLYDVKLAELTEVGSTLQSLIVTMEGRHLQFESVVSNNNSWLNRRLTELDHKLNTNTKQLIRKSRKQDKQLKMMDEQVNALKQQLDKLPVINTSMYCVTIMVMY